ncbi:uncharacterized protein LOC133187059 [Saccostrea echinata]|uniref:uncharacterized protein LOC133187059 n=1 Tax=Saccostrea echinata TaxID=191078 RepID=UPI002A80AF3A|nr:uncharacterized protein LOC133187059 [Saccostrea echinata]
MTFSLFSEFHRTISYLNTDVFVLTETYRRAVGILETQGWITLIGPPGSGKTMTAVQLAKRKLGCSGSAQGRKCTFYFCKSLSEISGLSNAKIEPYIILDDFMEQYRYYPSKLSEDKDNFDQIFKEFINTGLVHVILTIKEDTWKIFSKDALYLEIFKSNTHLNLKEKPLTAKEKEYMLRNHLRINHIDVATNKKEESLKQGQEDSRKMNIIQDIVTDLNGESAIVIHKDTIQKITRDLKDDFTFSVPVIIDLMCVSRYMMKNRDHILSKTFRETLKIHVTKWMKSEKDDDKKSICVVLFVGLCGGVVSLDDFHRNMKGKVYANVCKKYKVEPCDRLEVENMMKKNARVRAFVYSETNTSDTYTFHHDSLLDFFLFYVCADDENFFIENADIDYILSRCSLPEEKIKQRIAKTIGPTLENVELKAIDKLVDRIRVEIEQGHSIPNWKNHVFRNHETFNNKWNNVSSASNCEKSNTIGGDPRVEEAKTRNRINKRNTQDFHAF